ncbi:prepilin-type N-terminal cleavage/methylation domain-containing protein [Kordiimonas sp. SCSIO 12603]|uniref:prepilin-type N-terminal cleavage/methylation domain-containing protein n=1 Tax=Kordiimonas sp. SCSIO 12603 TaxID=2829596 RepID=UPI00210695E2|nr:prepilin-type N-terminal cleavage/methylation domain-containing protein [Kordiimonas sp. SCSIO 12603]UTW58737.1 prepilin-type N-terminal cleavage/methylation domain-containing protein [Kordiimonas sp. SCSIO 12603]
MQYGWGKAEDGFTLLEALVVIAIISFVVAITPYAYTRFIPQYQMKQFAYTVANNARSLRIQAAEEQRITRLEIVEGRQIRIVGTDEFLDAPTGTELDFNPNSLWPEEANNQVVFYPGGGSSGGEITLRNGRLSIDLKVNWVSGAVDVEL